MVFEDIDDYSHFDKDGKSLSIRILEDKIILNTKQSEIITRYCKKYLFRFNSLLKSWKYEISDKNIIEDHLLSNVRNVHNKREVILENVLIEFEKKWDTAYPEVRAFIDYMDNKAFHYENLPCSQVSCL